MPTYDIQTGNIATASYLRYEHFDAPKDMNIASDRAQPYLGRDIDWKLGRSYFGPFFTVTFTTSFLLKNMLFTYLKNIFIL